jgi:hypothetical protein
LTTLSRPSPTSMGSIRMAFGKQCGATWQTSCA